MVPVSTEPDESKTNEGSASSGLGDSGFKSEGIRDPQTDFIILVANKNAMRIPKKEVLHRSVKN